MQRQQLAADPHRPGHPVVDPRAGRDVDRVADGVRELFDRAGVEDRCRVGDGSVVAREPRIREQPLQRPRDVTGSARARVIAGIADQVGAGPVVRERVRHGVVEGSGRADEREVVSRVPHLARDALGLSDDDGFVVARDHDGRVAARLIGPGVPDPQNRGR